MPTTFTASAQGGEQDISSVGTTWTEVRMPLSTRRVTTQSTAKHYLQRGQSDGGARSGGAAIAADAAYYVELGAPTVAELQAGYRPIYVAMGTGTGTITVRSEVT